MATLRLNFICPSIYFQISLISKAKFLRSRLLGLILTHNVE